MQARRADRLPRREYHNSIGRMGEDTSSLSSAGRNRPRSQQERMEIRKRLQQQSKIPGHVKWTKWMNSEWKNRKTDVSLDCERC